MIRKTFILISFLYFSHVSLGSSDTDDDEDTSTVIVRYPEFKAGSTQQPFYSSSPSLESSTSKEMDKIIIDSFIDSNMGPEVRLLAHFSHTDSDTIKAFADSHCLRKPAQPAKLWQLVILLILPLFDAYTDLLSLTVLLNIAVMLDPSILLLNLFTFSDAIYKLNCFFVLAISMLSLSLSVSLTVF